MKQNSKNEQARRSRAKKDERWEREVVRSEGQLENRSRGIREAYPSVTKQESRVAALREQGLTNGEIARLFYVDIVTVDNQASSLRSKLGADRKQKLNEALPPAKSGKPIRTMKKKYDLPQIVSFLVS
jgi:DNA-binding NarL/FixJ family response regulator